MIYKIIEIKIKHLTLEKEILFCYNCINKNNNTVIFRSSSCFPLQVLMKKPMFLIFEKSFRWSLFQKKKHKVFSFRAFHFNQG